MCCRKTVLFLLILSLLVSIGGSVPAAAAVYPVSLAVRIGKEPMPATVEGWRTWYLQDKAYLELSSRINFQCEIDRLTLEVRRLEDRPDYRDASGFSVYLPETSGKLHLLSAGIAARQSGGTEYPFDQLLEHPLQAEAPARYPDPQRVIQTLQNLDIDPRALQDFHIYLLPYSMGEANGYGGNGYAFMAAEPAGENLIDNQLEVTLVHEFGHYLSFRYMDRSTAQGRELWDKFLKIRGIPWNDAGEAGSKAWGKSSEEVFAEDFRVWVGKPVVGSGYFGDLAYPEPNADKGRSLRQFFAGLPKNPASKGTDPWLNQEEGGLYGRLYREPIVIGGVGAVALAALFLAAKKRPRRPRRDKMLSFFRS